MTSTEPGQMNCSCPTVSIDSENCPCVNVSDHSRLPGWLGVTPTAFVTAGTSLYKIRLNATGYLVYPTAKP